MIVGLDFDNTIVCYDEVFYQAGRAKGLIDTLEDRSKAGVKSYFIDAGQEDKWTYLQGLVYGDFIKDATAYEGAIETIKQLLKHGHEVHIVSHKTRYPIIGPKLDFHQAALAWIYKSGLYDAGLVKENIHFNEEKSQKLKRISTLGCELFLDDLESILDHADFPPTCRGILFDPNRACRPKDAYECIHYWPDLISSINSAVDYA